MQDIVLVDMDGVLVDFDRAVVEQVALLAPHLANVVTGKREKFYFADNYSEKEIINLIRQIQVTPGFFLDMPMYPGAIDGLQRILDAGFHPRICSAPLRKNPTCVSDKMTWLQRNLAPHFSIPLLAEAYITKEKHLCPGLVLIDDRPKLEHSEQAEWVHVVFDQTYNQNAEGPRLNGWQDPNLETILREIKERKNG